MGCGNHKQINPEHCNLGGRERGRESIHAVEPLLGIPNVGIKVGHLLRQPVLAGSGVWGLWLLGDILCLVLFTFGFLIIHTTLSSVGK